MLKPDRNNKIIHFHNQQRIYSFSDKSLNVITEKIDKLLECTYNEHYESRPVVDCIDMACSMDHIHGTLTANAPNLMVDSTIHVIVIIHDEVWQKVKNDSYPEYATGEVEEIYYKGA